MAWSRALAIATAAAVGLCSFSALAALQPHRTSYRLSLNEAQGLSTLQSVQGGLVIEWQRACDGWLSRQRLGFAAATGDGGGFGHDVRFSSWESVDGSRLRYAVRSFEGERLLEEYRGEARMNGSGGGVASFTKPERREIPLPAGTVFPGEHLELVLAAARHDKRLVTHQVFDGWGFDALTEITTVIGNSRLLEPITEGEPGAGRVWPVSMAYYNVEAQRDVPEFEAAFLLSEDGILRELALDYGDFALSAALDELEMLEVPDC